MKRSLLLLLALSAMTLGSAPVGAYHSGTCTAPSTVLNANSAVTGDVDNGQIDHYKITVPANTSEFVHLQMAYGDLDLQVCRVNGSGHVCTSDNYAFVFDGCHLYDASLIDPEDPIFLAWGKPLTPGTYRVSVKHCFSSQDEGGCDYTDYDPVTGDIPLAPGALDPAPAIPYVLAFAAA